MKKNSENHIFFSEFSEFLKKHVNYQNILLLYMLIQNVTNIDILEHKTTHFTPQITLKNMEIPLIFNFFKYIFNIY